MKILIVGPLSSNWKANGTTRTAISHAVELGLDVYLWPTSLSSPFPHSSLLTKELRAPFDVVLNIHEAQHMHLDESTYASSPLRIAYLLGSGSPNSKKELAGRLAAYTMVIPASQRAHDIAEGQHRLLTEPASITAVLDQLATMPTRQWPEMSYTSSTNITEYLRFDTQENYTGIESLEARLK